MPFRNHSIITATSVTLVVIKGPLHPVRRDKRGHITSLFLINLKGEPFMQNTIDVSCLFLCLWTDNDVKLLCIVLYTIMNNLCYVLCSIYMCQLNVEPNTIYLTSEYWCIIRSVPKHVKRVDIHSDSFLARYTERNYLNTSILKIDWAPWINFMASSFSEPKPRRFLLLALHNRKIILKINRKSSRTARQNCWSRRNKYEKICTTLV